MRVPNASATFATILATALLFLWPAVLNRYPILFSDTGGFLEQALMPDIGWDKPWIYGPLLTPFHLRLSLWPAIAMQALLLSAALWLTQLATGATSLVRHAVLCAALAALTAAPWFVSLLMPDILAPITVLGLFVLARPPLARPLLAHPTIARPTLAAVGLVTTLAIAAHLAHLVIASACIAALGLIDHRTIRRTATPLLGALALLLASNVIGNHRLAISPFGADFALARLVADGPARATIDEQCPETGWRICAWRGRLPSNADDFLWDPHGPVWADGFGPTRLAPEAGAIVRATLLAHPGAVLTAALANTARQLVELDIGDTLGPDYLDVSVLPRVALYFPLAEAARLSASRQSQGALQALAAPLVPLQTLVLIAATLATAVIAAGARSAQSSPRRPVAELAALTLIALIANAAATGALSGPHDRYQARIAWLAVLPPLLVARRGASTRSAPAPPLPATGGSCVG